MAIIGLLTAFAGTVALAVGISLGLAMATMNNISDFDSITDHTTALPTQVYDIQGRLITQFFSDEKREIVPLDEMPKHLIYALVTREDQDFFQHNGFSVRGTFRAAVNVALGRYFSGGSTITQQLAGHLFADRTDISLLRKVRELWWAFQIERHWTKNEILEEYLNRMYFGANTYGVEAASQFYFGKSVREISVAESAILVIQLANPSLYNPFRRPNAARQMQRTILNQMVNLEYVSAEEADEAFTLYWNNFDFTRSTTATAFFDREDQAPYFSEHVRNQLQNEILLGSADIYRDGYSVYTTLDLDAQESAQAHLTRGVNAANRIFSQNMQRRREYADENFVPIIDMLSLAFNIPDIRVADARQRQQAMDYFLNEMTPLIDMLGLQFGENEQHPVRLSARAAHTRIDQQASRSTVEGALIAIEHETGHIKAMVGGSQFEGRNQLNRATQGRLQPGSAFKPLYYAAAIEDEIMTAATRLYDSPVVFWNEDGTPYTPMNYRGSWEGPVLFRRSLYRSMNVPSIKILNEVGFTSALNTSARLLGVPETSMAARGFVRRYPVGLGIVSVSPQEMAQAFGAFANRGRKVDAIAVRYIEDRHGRVIAEPESQLRQEQQRRSRQEAQLISPQTAYIMTDILRSTVDQFDGTLRYARNLAGGFGDMQMAGKTGTTQNWADAWTVGYSPYISTAVWVGFDRPGNSLGINQTGAVTAGPIWSRFMHDYHRDLEPREFERPTQGITEVEVSARSGLLVPENFQGRTLTEVFISGTEPREFDTLDQQEREQNERLLNRLSSSIETGGLGAGSPLRGFQGIDRPISFDARELGINISLDDDEEFDEPADVDEVNLLDDLDDRFAPSSPAPIEPETEFPSMDDPFHLPEDDEFSNPLLD
ncbi:penicillin-binding protein, 1A family [Spirochaeta africana DSM 8902]|uniref:peptidoglycan glycosyltransferase n=2 Tax=Spirochaeta TaxID=146 RepID=H9UKC3_SPIAZ|nr:penicillin-binding protein, 1A family [Spirochaeta africana DSM 8902]